MENNNQQSTTFTCSGDCLQCSFQQRVYCSAQMTRNSLDVLEDIRQRLDRIEKSNAASEQLFNPMTEEASNEEVVVEEEQQQENV